ncbi:unnamed protein product, partial [Amoebophrya sp. A120]|eukprot:GSA120T00026384001.1
MLFHNVQQKHLNCLLPGGYVLGQVLNLGRDPKTKAVTNGFFWVQPLRATRIGEWRSERTERDKELLKRLQALLATFPRL